MASSSLAAEGGEAYSLPSAVASITSSIESEQDCEVNHANDLARASVERNASKKQELVGDNQIARIPRKTGCPSHLARFREHYPLSEPIVPLPYAALDDPHWFTTYSGYLLRHLRDGQDARGFKLLPAMQAHISNRIRELDQTPVGRFFEDSVEIRGQRLPP